MIGKKISFLHKKNKNDEAEEGKEIAFLDITSGRIRTGRGRAAEQDGA